jgi:hypothetical protein
VLEKLDRWFFEYYVFDLNLAVPSICFFLFRLFQCHLLQSLAGLAVTVILVWDAWSLRGEIARHTNQQTLSGSQESGSSPNGRKG